VKELFRSLAPPPSGGAAPLRRALGFELLGPSSGAFRVGKPARLRPALECEHLEVRIVPAAAVNVYTDALHTNLLSTDGNWSLGHKPTGMEIAQFDKNFSPSSNDPCTVDITHTVGGLTFVNGYTGTVTINGAIDLQVQTTVGGVTDWTNGGTVVTFQMASLSSEIDLEAGGTFQAFTINGPGGGGGGLLLLGNGAFTDTQAAVNTWADVKIGGDTATFILNTNNATSFVLRDGATMTVASGSTLALGDSNGKQLISATSINSYVANSGTVLWQWANGTANTKINVALLNYGTVSIDDQSGTGAMGSVGLEFMSSSPTTGDDAVKMDGGSITLKNQGRMIVDAGYYQTGGTFTTNNPTANTRSYLYLNNTHRVAEFDGGTVSMGGAVYQALAIDTQDGGGATVTVNLHGAELDVTIKGDTSAIQNQLYCPNGTVDINNASKLVVTSGVAVKAMKTWTIILANGIPNDFTDANKDVTHATGVKTFTRSLGAYELGS
jgi:hypothetical protein